ncbi:hypothetical protein MGMO_120c00090 [Methyloglobulus morosus KoM1]|uniref:Uncharacterized protein n=1 Tax=Methyloglobulus morosus KoM1 TaxID=1116472 RepID=V5BWN2_9GAMM|nr:hypothetical protein MGMO_120c00090 [Methyloglobulus morosus KoM1]
MLLNSASKKLNNSYKPTNHKALNFQKGYINDSFPVLLIDQIANENKGNLVFAFNQERLTTVLDRYYPP